MKSYKVMFLAFVFVGCSATEQQAAREGFENVERGTGMALENASEIIGVGVKKVGGRWQRPDGTVIQSQDEYQETIDKPQSEIIESDIDLGQPTAATLPAPQ